MTTKEKIDHIVKWISDYAKQAGIESLVVGVSGGVDSAIVSTLCAMTGMPTCCLLLPINQNEEETERGRNHIMWLKDRYENVYAKVLDLSDIFDDFRTYLHSKGFVSELGFANSKARLRMTALYQVSASTNGLVVGTGNAVELAIGFYGKYADGGVDIEPIGQLSKTEVYEMAKALGINEDIISAPPTDGLFDDGRTDEDAIGATYKELEFAMEYYQSLNPNYNGLNIRQKEVLKIYTNLHNKSEHKRNLPPICKTP